MAVPHSMEVLGKKKEYRCPVCGEALTVHMIHRGGDGWIIECEPCKNPSCTLYKRMIAFESRTDPRIRSLDSFFSEAAANA